MNLIRHPRLDLPVFETLEFHPVDFLAGTTPPPNQLTAVRRIEIGDSSSDIGKRSGAKLHDVLRIADEVFAEAADECGARVVDHQWCLLTGAALKGKLYLEPQEIVPEQFRLGARVAILEKSTPLDDPTMEQISAGLQTHRNKSEYDWYDGNLGQFTYGTKRTLDADARRVPSLWLHDLDIYIRKKP